MSLDRLESALAIEGAERKAMRVPVANGVPRFVFSQTAAALVLVHGAPVWRAVPGTSFQRILNTRALLLRDPAGSWSNEIKTNPSTASGANTAAARQAGDARSASSGWGGESSHSGGWGASSGGGGRSWGGGGWGGGGGGSFGGFHGRR